MEAKHFTIHIIPTTVQFMQLTSFQFNSRSCICENRWAIGFKWVTNNYWRPVWWQNASNVCPICIEAFDRRFLFVITFLRHVFAIINGALRRLRPAKSVWSTSCLRQCNLSSHASRRSARSVALRRIILHLSVDVSRYRRLSTSCLPRSISPSSCVSSASE